MCRMILTLNAGRIIGGQSISSSLLAYFISVRLNELLRYAYWCFRSPSHRIENHNNLHPDGDSEQEKKPLRSHLRLKMATTQFWPRKFNTISKCNFQFDDGTQNAPQTLNNEWIIIGACDGHSHKATAYIVGDLDNDTFWFLWNWSRIISTLYIWNTISLCCEFEIKNNSKTRTKKQKQKLEMKMTSSFVAPMNEWMNEFNKISLESRANHTHSESIEFDDDNNNNTNEKLEKSKCYDFFVARTLNKFVGIDAIFSYAATHIRCMWAAVADSRRIEWQVFANDEPRDQPFSYLYVMMYKLMPSFERCTLSDSTGEMPDKGNQSHLLYYSLLLLLWNTVVMWMIGLLSDRYWIPHSTEDVINR